MKLQHILLAASTILMAGSLQAQVKQRGERETTKPAKSVSATTPVSATTQSSTMTDEPAEDLSKLTTAETCREYAEEKTRWLDAEVGGLSAEQREQVFTLFNTAYLDIKAVKEANPEMPRAELKAKGKEEIGVAKRDALRLLTPEQQAQISGWQGERQNTAKGQAQERAQRQTEELDAAVGLTTEQKQQVLDLNTSLWQESLEWKKANPEASGEEKKTYAKEMMRRRVEGYRGLLTPEQLESYKVSRKGDGGKSDY